MHSSALLADFELQGFLRSSGVVVMAILFWLILSVLSSLFLKRAGPARGLLNQLRFVFFPSVIFYAVARYWVESTPPTVLKVAQTAVAGSAVMLAMGLLNLLATPPRMRRWLKREIPALLIDVVRYLVLIVAVALILKVVWGEDVGPLIGALGIGGIVLGLALQETLSNFFSGLAILAERPFSLGDWVRIGESLEGQVEHVTWRAVKLRTLDNNYMIFPNSVVAKEKVINYNLPSPAMARRLQIGTSYNDPPERVKRTILDVLANAKGVLDKPAPSVSTVLYADFSINYELKFYIDDFSDRREIEDRVLSRIWYAFKRRGIEIPFPIRHLYHHDLAQQRVTAPEAQAEQSAESKGNAEIERILAQVPLFVELSAEERHTLARGAHVLEFGDGERVIRQTDPGEALYVIIGGAARVGVRGNDGQERDVATLKAGNVFGEMSLLTGEARTASVYGDGELEVAEVPKAALAPILTANPALAGTLAEVMVRRRQELEKAKIGPEATEQKGVETARRSLLERIRGFFGLRG